MRKSMVFGGAAVTLMGGLGGVAALQGPAGATTWAHNTTPIKVSIINAGTDGAGSTFKAQMTNNTGTSQTGTLCVEFLTETATHKTNLVLEKWSCTKKHTIAAGTSIKSTFIQDTTDWAFVAGKWKNATGTTVSQVRALTFHV